MSIAAVVTRGYSNGSFTGSIAFVSTRGYTAGDEGAPAGTPAHRGFASDIPGWPALKSFEEFQALKREHEEKLRDAVLEAAKHADTLSKPIKRIANRRTGSTHGLFNKTALNEVKQLSAQTNNEQLLLLAQQLEEIQAEMDSLIQVLDDDAIAILLLSV